MRLDGESDCGDRGTGEAGSCRSEARNPRHRPDEEPRNGQSPQGGVPHCRTDRTVRAWAAHAADASRRAATPGTARQACCVKEGGTLMRTRESRRTSGTTLFVTALALLAAVVIGSANSPARADTITDDNVEAAL